MFLTLNTLILHSNLLLLYLMERFICLLLFIRRCLFILGNILGFIIALHWYFRSIWPFFHWRRRNTFLQTYLIYLFIFCLYFCFFELWRYLFILCLFKRVCLYFYLLIRIIGQLSLQIEVLILNDYLIKMVYYVLCLCLFLFLNFQLIL